MARAATDDRATREGDPFPSGRFCDRFCGIAVARADSLADSAQGCEAAQNRRQIRSYENGGPGSGRAVGVVQAVSVVLSTSGSGSCLSADLYFLGTIRH